jgi:hypothetical protein
MKMLRTGYGSWRSSERLSQHSTGLAMHIVRWATTTTSPFKVLNILNNWGKSETDWRATVA